MQLLILTMALAATLAAVQQNGTLKLVEPSKHCIMCVAYAFFAEEHTLPQFHPETGVSFLLFTRRNPTIPDIITYTNVASLTSSHFNATHATRFIIHGLLNNAQSRVNTLIRGAYIDRGEYNVIIVDWGEGADLFFWDYAIACTRIRDVGIYVASFVDWVNLVTGTPFTSFSIIGHSLGGHCAGIVGKHVKRGRLQRIVALDPAGPLHSIDEPDTRVAQSDAVYVEVIHTNAGCFGFEEPLGDADFYPNWGRCQPACGLDLTGFCAHSRAYEWFAQSVRDEGRFVGTKCANYDEIKNIRCTASGPNRIMGGDLECDSPSNGVFYVAISFNSPRAHAFSLQLFLAPIITILFN